jgi:hypothetical protein
MTQAAILISFLPVEDTRIPDYRPDRSGKLVPAQKRLDISIRLKRQGSKRFRVKRATAETA